MVFLHWLAQFRTPVLTAFLSAVTYLGDEVAFIALAVILYWCISKRQAFFIFCAGAFSLSANQFLKLWCRIPRPWVLDPDLTIVESARAAAIGYSFPSGHSQNIVTLMGPMMLCNRNKLLRTLCAVGLVLVPFSRMYLGVHTPLDVGVGVALSAVLVLAFYPSFRTERIYLRRLPWMLAAAAIVTLLTLLYVLCYTFPADVDAENLQSGIKTAYTMMGLMPGLILGRIADERYLHFDTAAPLWGQVAKVVLGLALLLGLRAGLKAPLNALFHGSMVAQMVRYFIVVLFATVLWPMTFPWFARIGKKHCKNRLSC